MNLKEAFRFQNRLQQLMNEASGILADPDNIVRVEMTHLRKKVMPEAENEVVIREPSTPFSEQINQLVDFLLYLLEQRESLSGAIQKAKAGMDVDMDMEAGLNSQRQSIAATFRAMANLRASELLLPLDGMGYRFNAEGNQVAYRCDLKKVTTINFDRNKVRKLASKLYAEADAMSTKLDVALVSTEVAYQPPFDVNGTFADIFEWYCEA